MGEQQGEIEQRKKLVCYVWHNQSVDEFTRFRGVQRVSKSYTEEVWSLISAKSREAPKQEILFIGAFKRAASCEFAGMPDKYDC